MDEVREVVDIDLGITDRNNPPVTGKELQAFLYISNANKVIAAAFVEHIEKVGCSSADDVYLYSRSTTFSQGYPCIATHDTDPDTGNLPLLKREETPMKAVCGISRLWVFKQCRRKKIASRLMDCVRYL